MQKKILGVGAVVLMLLVAIVPVITSSVEGVREQGEVEEDIMKKYLEDLKPVLSDAPEIDPDRVPQVIITGDGQVIFTPPYEWVTIWTQLDGIAVDAYSMGNKESGLTGVFVNVWIGGARAGARQKVSFYVPTPRTLTISQTFRGWLGGMEIVPFSGSTAYLVCLIDNDGDDGWYLKEIKTLFDYNWFLDRFLWFASAVTGYMGSDLAQAIVKLQAVNDVFRLLVEMDKMSNINEYTMTVSKHFEPGWHTVEMGLRADAFAGGVGMAFLGVCGVVTDITIDGISPVEISCPVEGGFYRDNKLINFNSVLKSFGISFILSNSLTVTAKVINEVSYAKIYFDSYPETAPIVPVQGQISYHFVLKRGAGLFNIEVIAFDINNNEVGRDSTSCIIFSF